MSLLDRPSRPVGTLARLRPAAAGRVRRAARQAARAVRELLLIIALFTVYKLSRLLASGRVVGRSTAPTACGPGRVLDLPSETGVQHGLLQSQFLVQAANSYYAYVHCPAVIAFLLWVYLRRPSTTGGSAGSWRR